MGYSLIGLWMFGMGRSALGLAFCRRIVAVTAVAAITVATAALARLALLAIFQALFLARSLAVRTRLGVVGRGWYQRVTGFIRARNQAGMCCIKTVGLHASCCRCNIAVGAVVTALVAAAIATFATLFTALTPFAAALALAFSAWLALTVASGVLHGALLALRCVAFVHGRSHGRLIRQCEILLLRIAGRAVGALATLAALCAITTATTTAAFAAAL